MSNKQTNRPCAKVGLFGEQGSTDEDRAYQGSRYNDLKAAIFENPYQRVWGSSDADPLPVYEATVNQVFCGAFPGGTPDQLLAASIRTVDTRADLRWGKDRKGFRRIVHPNGICLFGLWEIDRENSFSGYFKKAAAG